MHCDIMFCIRNYHHDVSHGVKDTICTVAMCFLRCKELCMHCDNVFLYGVKDCIYKEE